MRWIAISAWWKMLSGLDPGLTRFCCDAGRSGQVRLRLDLADGDAMMDLPNFDQDLDSMMGCLGSRHRSGSS